MINDDSKKAGRILPHDAVKIVRGMTRRDFIKYSTGTVACLTLGSMTFGVGSALGQTPKPSYPIDSTVVTTRQRMVSFPLTMSSVPPNLMPTPPNNPNGGPGLAATQLCEVSKYEALGYGAWKFGAPLPLKQRTDLMPAGYSNPTPTRHKRILHFFTMTDIHITDKEAPNQLIYFQQFDSRNSAQNTSIYSPVMMYSTQVLDAAIQTVNALHEQNQFDFGISLGGYLQQHVVQ